MRGWTRGPTLREYLREVNAGLDRYLTRGVKWILLANVMVFLAIKILFTPLNEDLALKWVAQNPIAQFRESTNGELGLRVNPLCIPQFFTYMFVHLSVWHLAMNMLSLWFFGPPLESRWGTAIFVKYYLLTGFAAGALHGMLAPFFYRSSYVMFGASGAVFAVLLAFAMYFPHEKVLLYFVVPIPARVFVILLGLFTFYSLFGTENITISHLTHLAGLGFGYLWIRLAQVFPDAWWFNERVLPFGRR